MAAKDCRLSTPTTIQLRRYLLPPSLPAPIPAPRPITAPSWDRLLTIKIVRVAKQLPVQPSLPWLLKPSEQCLARASPLAVTQQQLRFLVQNRPEPSACLSA